jgi:hypothetical protein
VSDCCSLGWIFNPRHNPIHKFLDINPRGEATLAERIDLLPPFDDPKFG